MSEFFNIKCIDKPSRKSKKRFNGRLWEINGGIYPEQRVKAAE